MKSTWDKLTVEEKLEVTEHIFRQLNRHLIYGRLKLLHPTAYSILFDAGGQNNSRAKIAFFHSYHNCLKLLANP